MNLIISESAKPKKCNIEGEARSNFLTTTGKT